MTIPGPRSTLSAEDHARWLADRDRIAELERELENAIFLRNEAHAANQVFQDDLAAMTERLRESVNTYGDMKADLERENDGLRDEIADLRIERDLAQAEAADRD